MTVIDKIDNYLIEDEKKDLIKNLKKAGINISNLTFTKRKNTIDVYSKVDPYSNTTDMDVRLVGKLSKKILITTIDLKNINDKDYINYVKDWLARKF